MRWRVRVYQSPAFGLCVRTTWGGLATKYRGEVEAETKGAAITAAALKWPDVNAGNVLVDPIEDHERGTGIHATG